MDEDTAGARQAMPESAAALIDLAARWMHDTGLTGQLAGATLEFVLDDHGRVRAWFAKSRGGRTDLDATWAAAPS